ncbi:MAG: hypothetical protein ACK4P4_13620 [Allorhizobium sp.]
MNIEGILLSLVFSIVSLRFGRDIGAFLSGNTTKDGGLSKEVSGGPKKSTA